MVSREEKTLVETCRTRESIRKLRMLLPRLNFHHRPFPLGANRLSMILVCGRPAPIRFARRLIAATSPWCRLPYMLLVRCGARIVRRLASRFPPALSPATWLRCSAHSTCGVACSASPRCGRQSICVTLYHGLRMRGVCSLSPRPPGGRYDAMSITWAPRHCVRGYC